MAIGVVADNLAYRFGPFTLAVNERLLSRNGIATDLGGRALDRKSVV